MGFKGVSRCRIGPVDFTATRGPDDGGLEREMGTEGSFPTAGSLMADAFVMCLRSGLDFRGQSRCLYDKARTKPQTKVSKRKPSKAEGLGALNTKDHSNSRQRRIAEDEFCSIEETNNNT
jgi:hypothetical protein